MCSSSAGSLAKSITRALMLPLAVGIWGGQSPPRRTIEALLYGPARALRADAGTLSGHAIGEQPDRVPVVDLLGDVGAVYVRAERADRPGVWSEDLCALLAELRPELYGAWTPDVLAAALKPLGIDTAQLHMLGEDGQRRNKRGIRVATSPDTWTPRWRGRPTRSDTPGQGSTTRCCAAPPTALRAARRRRGARPGQGRPGRAGLRRQVPHRRGLRLHRRRGRPGHRLRAGRRRP